MKNRSKETEAGVIQGKARGFNSNNVEKQNKRNLQPRILGEENSHG